MDIRIKEKAFVPTLASSSSEIKIDLFQNAADTFNGLCSRRIKSMPVNKGFSAVSELSEAS